MTMIMPDDNIDRGMELDPSGLGSRNIPLIVNVMDMIILYDGENASQITNNTGLSAVMDIAVPYCMRTHRLLAPSVELGDKGAVALGLGAILIFVF